MRGTTALLVIFVAGDEDDDVFDEMPTSSTDVETRSSSDLNRSAQHHHHHQGLNTDGGVPFANVEFEDRLRDVSEDQRAGISAPVDVKRQQSGFQRRRLGQLQLKHRLAIDLPDQSSPVTRGSHPEESDFVTTNGQATAVSGRPENLAAPNELVLKIVWNTLDDPDFQFYVAFVVAVATLAVALNVSPAWVMIAVSGMSLLHFAIDER